MSEPLLEPVVFGPGRVLPVSALSFEFVRSSGPGGQNVNKVSTRVILSVDLVELAALMPGPAMARLRRLAGANITATHLKLASSDSRSQWTNRVACVDRLRALLEQAMIAPKPRRPTKPTRGSIERRLQAKQRKGERKQQRGRPRRAGED